MSEHLAHRLDRHSVCQRYGCGEGVAGEVEGQSFFNTANRCDLFEVVVTLLIGGYREQSVVAATTLIFPKFATEHPRGVHLPVSRSFGDVCEARGGYSSL